MNILEEHGIHYIMGSEVEDPSKIKRFYQYYDNFDGPFVDHHGFKPFVYHWKHIPTNKNGIKTIYAISCQSFLALLSWWNMCKDWEYSVIP